jgi:two-component sensor histidine kinase
MNPSDELIVRFGALRVGYRLGWFSVAAVLAALAFDTHARHRGVLLVCTFAVAVVNTAAPTVPWREWLVARRGRLLLDLWCVGLIAFVSLLVLEGGQSFALLLFLTVPFIAVVQAGRRRVLLFAGVVASCVAATAMTPAELGTSALRLVVVAAVAAVAIVAARTIRLQQTLRRESDHRITNDLQAAADLLLLAGPEETAQRIRAIAAVHRALANGHGRRVAADELLHAIAATASVPVAVDAEPTLLEAATAQRVGAGRE